MNEMEKEFYDSIPNMHTRREYRNGLQRFSAWFGKSADEILEIRKADLKSDDTFARKRFERELEKFHAYLKAPKPQGEGAASNSAKTLCSGLRQFFRLYEVPLTLRRGSPIGKSQVTDKTFPLTIEDVRRMFAVADMKQRVMLSMAKDLGLRIGDFVRIKKDLPDLNQEPPIAFDVMTHKEGVLAKCHLSAETVELLKTYVPMLANNPNPYLFPSNSEGFLKEDTIGWNLKQLAEKAGLTIPSGKRLTFHAFRKLFISTGKNLNVDPDVIKAMCGKGVAQDIMAYMTGVQWRKAFSQIADVLKIQGFTAKNHVRLEDLEERNKKLEETVFDQDLRIQALLERLKELDPNIRAKYERTLVGLRERASASRLKRKEETETP
jgi:integrase